MAVLNDTTNIGLANRFLVTVIPGDYDLGSWQKADGLDVSWEMPDYRAGDAGNARWFVPAHTKYSAVTLTRAACDDSTKVRDWLNLNSFNFSKSRSSVKVQLFDSTGSKTIIEWELRNAQPKKWSVTGMDAGASQISIEKLEFEHEGFLEDETKIGGAPVTPPATKWPS